MSISQGKKIRLIRESAGMGRQAFSDTTGIPKDSLIGYEMERIKPGGEVLSAIAGKWPEYAAYLLTDETDVKQRNPEVESVARELENQKKAS
ncbi:hypothetical protein A7981_08500 [Methylovorus sp. MM2]|uniref:helix-turn-helix domain-containing protein n=1 Tax=Methylovorus sp. MM2 TaxID=1848038 RepID=UPI0007E01880|nr:helix-turn-helix transcriptional regulator [Methylovorus sp. MM2]OAM51520.1 hypothetical protein A7981_08500 [Methylovorus sp. MM2]